MFHLFKMLSLMPLWLLHGVGWVLGWITYVFSGTYRRRFNDNAAQAGIDVAKRHLAVGEAGKMVAELPRVWLGTGIPVQWKGAGAMEAALASTRGMIVLTPHLGSFDMAGQAYAQHFGIHGHPLTVLFSPPRQSWLRDIVIASRAKPGLQTAPATLAGVRQLLKVLKSGGSIALLPDQVPPEGQGVWAPFFERKAYTMTLAARLAAQTGADVMLVWGERLSWGRGFVVHVQKLDCTLSTDIAAATLQINQAMEALVRQMPQQYLWGYARYKAPRAAT
jgi:Kdo2-lipid IVA lauroyltransferase/acyltransferase